MSALAEASLEPVSWRRWLLRALATIVVIALLVGLALWLKSMLGSPAGAKRQVAKISILPDTPPPPPPPPREEPKKEPPKAETKQLPQQDQPKPQQAPPPADAPIKMEGPAGDGPSAFSAGAVTQEYKGGAPAVGASGVGSAGGGVDRANERLYANTARQLLQGELQRQIRPDAGELSATLAIWIEPDGQIRRFELQASAQPERDAEMRSALEATTRSFRLPPPPPVALSSTG